MYIQVKNLYSNSWDNVFTIDPSYNEIKNRDYYYKDNNKLYVDEFWGHGMSTFLAQAMNTSRQNIDRYVSLGKIKESRTMDKAIYELLGEKIW